MKLIVFLMATALWADEAAVRALIQRYVDAREKIDPAAAEALFTPDADQLVSSGEWRKGRDAVVKGSMASSRQNEGKRTITVESVRMLAPTVALADGLYQLGDRRMRATILCTRGTDGIWRISAIRNMLPTSGK